jgi:hypothetical protein
MEQNNVARLWDSLVPEASFQVISKHKSDETLGDWGIFKPNAPIHWLRYKTRDEAISFLFILQSAFPEAEKFFVERIGGDVRTREIGGKTVSTRTSDDISCCSLKYEAGTNGYHGGDWGHGSRTYLRLENVNSINWEVSVDGNKFKEPISMEIVLGGDCELEAIKKALRFMLATLEQQSVKAITAKPF